MDERLKAALAAKLAELRRDYLAGLPEEFARLRAIAAALEGGESDRAALDELHHRLHKLAGSGGTFGLAALSAAARPLEQRVKAWLAGALDAIDAQALGTLASELEALPSTVPDVPEGPVAMAPKAPAPARGKAIEVWLVEDEPLQAEALSRQLESFNYVVRTFAHIDEAERAAAQAMPDMLILDVLFEGGVGNTTEALVRCPNLSGLDCPLMFVSAFDDFNSRVRAARLGAVGYFLKPLDVPQLVNRMSQVFEQRLAPPQRVLIVDDDATLAEHYRLVLLAAGMEAEILRDPRTIVETVSAVRPELILMDVHMPGYSGPELAGVIRQHERWTSLPIVYLSAETDLGQQIDALGRGADDFLTKPIRDTQLVAAVRARVERARQIDALISKDSLTGLLKHASIKEALELEVARARRLHKPISVAMLDIDHFKSVNDTYGHAAGDVVISAVAMLLRQRLRKSDLVGRYGGEEFVAVLPECTSADARLLMEDVRQRFSELSFSHTGKAFSCTISVGVATARHDLEAGSTERRLEWFLDAELLVMADDALYAAKHGGRNQVRAADSLPPYRKETPA